MGWRWRKSWSPVKGVRINFSNRGVGASVGGKGFRVGTGTRGTYTSVSIPGTGLSNVTYHGQNGSAGATSGNALKSCMGCFSFAFIALMVLGSLGGNSSDSKQAATSPTAAPIARAATAAAPAPAPATRIPIPVDVPPVQVAESAQPKYSAPRISEGMSLEEMQRRFGTGTRVKRAALGKTTRETWEWNTSAGYILADFSNDKLTGWSNSNASALAVKHTYGMPADYGTANRYQPDSARQGYSTPSYSDTSRSHPPIVGSPEKTVHVKGYYRKDGTYVRPHTRRPPKR